MKHGSPIFNGVATIPDIDISCFLRSGNRGNSHEKNDLMWWTTKTIPAGHSQNVCLTLGTLYGAHFACEADFANPRRVFAELCCLCAVKQEVVVLEAKGGLL